MAYGQPPSMSPTSRANMRALPRKAAAKALTMRARRVGLRRRA